jgi:hypothetical protein
VTRAVPRPSSPRATSRTPFWATAAIAAVVIASVLVVQNHSALTTEILPTGDAAADVLLVESAQHRWLLTGHYSRFDFNHPGPFFFELRRLGEWLAGDLVPGAYNGDLLGVLIGNALFVGIGSAAAALLAGSGWNAGAAAAAAVLLVLRQVGSGGLLSDTWMPSVLVAPFFAFVLLLGHVARGRVRLLPATTFCAGALAHGYVVLLPIVALVLPVAAATGLRRRLRRGATVPRWVLPAALVVALAFAAPALLDVALHFPGNLGRIVATTLGTPGDASRSWRRLAASSRSTGCRSRQCPPSSRRSQDWWSSRTGRRAARSRRCSKRSCCSPRRWSSSSRGHPASSTPSSDASTWAHRSRSSAPRSRSPSDV